MKPYTKKLLFSEKKNLSFWKEEMGNKPVTGQSPNNLNEGYCKSKPKYVESKKTCHSQPSSLEKSFSHRSEYDRIAMHEYNKHALSMDYTPYFTKDDPVSV